MRITISIKYTITIVCISKTFKLTEKQYDHHVNDFMYLSSYEVILFMQR